jgi:hypothetical protein
VVATGAVPMSYQWQYNGSAIVGATNTALVLPAVQATNAGTYKVVIANKTGTATSTDAVLTVTGAPVLFNARTTPEGMFAFALGGIPSVAYVIEVTTNLQQWTPLAVLTNLTGQTDFTDTTSTNTPSRFYRARVAE